MSRQTVLAVLVFGACVMAVPLEAMADTWCNSNYPPDPAACHCDAIWCEDADRFCNGAPACPPAPPEQCPDQTWSWMLLRQAFPRTSAINDGANLCGVEFKGDEDTRLFDDPPLGVRNPRGDLGQATIDLTDDIHYTFGAQYDTVVGTDQSPLLLRFDFSGGVPTNLHVQYDIGYFELFLDTGQPNQNRAPMDYILVGNEEDPINNPGCISCYNMCEPGQDPSVHSPWPHVCQSYEARTEAPACPPAQTNVRTAIAVGANALLDNNPCHCETSGDQKPRNYHLSFYDGLKWRILSGPSAPGPGGENAVWTTDHPEGKYFILGAKINRVWMWVKPDTVDIQLYAKRTLLGGGGEAAVTSRVEGLKREYLGEFNKLHAGAAIGCEMDSNGNCVGNRHCIHEGYDRCDGLGKTVYGRRWLEHDEMALSGGAAAAQEGACCLGGGACGVMLPDACATAEGVFAGGGTVCDGTVCEGACCAPTGDCTDTAFDACSDTFQGLGTNCATTVCPCATPFADSDADGDVDQDDFNEFQACYTGPGPATVVGLCRCFDQHAGPNDPDVDEDDYGAFEACASGPDVPADPACE